MTPMAELGEFEISTPQHDHVLIASFANMAKIGNPIEIVDSYSVLNGLELNQVIDVINRAEKAYGAVPVWLLEALRKPAYWRQALRVSTHVLECCCDDDIDYLVGEWRPGKRGIVYRPGKMPIKDIIVMARALMEHGIIGKVKVRRLQKNERVEGYTKEFKAIDYINAACMHFSMPRDEAEKLTMTRFQLLLKSKYPEEKGLTRDEYDDAMANFEKRQAQRMKNHG